MNLLVVILDKKEKAKIDFLNIPNHKTRYNYKRAEEKVITLNTLI